MYYRLGVHWTDRGILIGYQELIRQLQKRFPDMQPWSRSDFELQPAPDSGDSWAWRLYMSDLLPQHPMDLVPVRRKQSRFVPEPDARDYQRRTEFVNEDSRLPICVLLGDSFSEPMSEFLAENFSRTFGYRNINFDAQTIEQHHPDVVIQLFNERCLVSQDPRQLLEQARQSLGPLDTEVKRVEHAHESAVDLQAQFAGATDVRLKVDLSPRGPALNAFGKAQIQRLEHPDGSELVVETHDTTDGFYLPSFDFPQTRVALLQIEIESPAATRLDVLDSTQADPDAAEAEIRREFQLPKGASKLVLDLVHHPGSNGRLIICPGSVPGRYILHSIEVRVVGG